MTQSWVWFRFCSDLVCFFLGTPICRLASLPLRQWSQRLIGDFGSGTSALLHDLRNGCTSFVSVKNRALLCKRSGQGEDLNSRSAARPFAQPAVDQSTNRSGLGGSREKRPPRNVRENRGGAVPTMKAAFTESAQGESPGRHRRFTRRGSGRCVWRVRGECRRDS
jgi:hypothetical protein